MDIQPATAPAPVAPAHPSNTRFIITIIGVLVLTGVLVAIAFSPIGARIKTSYALKGVGVAEANYYSTRVDTFGWFGTDQVTVENIGDYASGAMIALDGGNIPTRIIGLDGTVLVEDQVQKGGLAISSDGAYIAYSYLSSPDANGKATPALSAWTVRVMNLESGESYDAGIGFGAQFFQSNGNAYLLFTSPTGPTIADLSTKTSATTYMLNEGVVDGVVKISADGRYVAMQNVANERYTIYSVDALSPALTLSPVRTIETELADVMWKGSTLFGITLPMEGQVSITRYQPEDASEEVVHTFTTPKLYRLISL